MPNRPSLQRGGPREAAVLEALRSGATRAAAGAAGGVSRRTFFRQMERSAAFAHDVALAEDEAERRATSVVYDAAMGGDVKAAMFWLERRRPVEWRQQTQVDGRTVLEQEYPPDLLAMVRRYSGLTDQELETEVKRLAWVVPADSAGEGQRANGGAAAMLALPAAPTDEAAQVAPDAAEAADEPEPPAAALTQAGQPAEPLPPLVYTPEPEPQRCQHCRGRVPGRHEEGCPAFLPDGRLRNPWAALGGDPR